MVTSTKAQWKKLPTLKARLQHEIMYYVDDSSSQTPSIHSYIRNLEKYVQLKFIKQKTEISGIGINYLRISDDYDIE
uniref:Reverse transcriptase domain-containing protein n=1 Tax=Strongyloides venezuelensis TaxID=75913 RepID=A0A0K0FP75_STRVS